MTEGNKNKLILSGSIIASFISGCIVGRYSKGQFVLLRLLLGSILLAFAIGPDTFGWFGIIYCLRCFLGIIGAFIIGKLTDYNLQSFGMLIIGILIYFSSMYPNSFDIVSSYINLDQPVLQILFRLVGVFMIAVGVKKNEV